MFFNVFFFYCFRSVFVDRFEKVMHIHYGQVEFYKVTPNVWISLLLRILPVLQKIFI